MEGCPGRVMAFGIIRQCIRSLVRYDLGRNDAHLIRRIYSDVCSVPQPLVATIETAVAQSDKCSRASVGCATALRWTVVSTTTPSRSLGPMRPVLCASLDSHRMDNLVWVADLRLAWHPRSLAAAAVDRAACRCNKCRRSASSLTANREREDRALWQYQMHRYCKSCDRRIVRRVIGISLHRPSSDDAAVEVKGVRSA